MTTRPSGAHHAASSVQVEERLRTRHISFTLEPTFRLDEIADVEGNQVRLIEHRAPAEMVKRFSEQMKAGAVFPAIVVNDRGELIDGNTRKRAALKAGQQTIAAYICSGLSGLQARSLSVELNQCHGLSMTEEEVHAFVTGAVREGQTLDTKAYARMTGIRPSTVARWTAQAMFQQRAVRCGIGDATVASLSQSAQAALNAVRLTPVLVKLTALAAEARVSSSDVKSLVAEVNGATSEADALAIVTRERDARHGDIRAVASGFTAPKSKGRHANMHVAALLKLDVNDLLDVAPEKQSDMVTKLRGLRDHLDRAVNEADERWLARGNHPSAATQPSSQLCASGASNG